MDGTDGRSDERVTFNTFDELKINIMRLSGNFDLTFINRVTLHEYSLMQYAHAMRNADKRLENAFSAVFNRIAQGLEGKIKISDIYDHEEATLELFSKKAPVTDKMRVFAEVNARLGGESNG